MTFRVPLLQRSTIKSDDGFLVKLKSRDRLRYVDRQSTLEMKIDIGGGLLSLVIPSLGEFNPAVWHDLSQDRKNEIIRNIVSALMWRGWRVNTIGHYIR